MLLPFVSIFASNLSHDGTHQCREELGHCSFQRVSRDLPWVLEVWDSCKYQDYIHSSHCPIHELTRKGRHCQVPSDMPRASCCHYHRRCHHWDKVGRIDHSHCCSCIDQWRYSHICSDMKTDDWLVVHQGKKFLAFIYWKIMMCFCFFHNLFLHVSEWQYSLSLHHCWPMTLNWPWKYHFPGYTTPYVCHD